MNWLGRLSVCLVLSAAALSLYAGPFQPAKRSAPAEIRCLAGIKKINVRVGSVPADLKQFMDDNLLDALTRSRLTSAGFEVVDDAEAPELVFNFKTLTDPAWPDLMGVVLLLDVEQKVEVLRLGEKMRLPTTTVVSRALANRETIRDVIAQRALNATSQFINLCKQLE